MGNSDFDKAYFKTSLQSNFNYWVGQISPFKKLELNEAISFLKFNIRRWLDQRYAIEGVIDPNYIIDISSEDGNSFDSSVTVEIRNLFASTPERLNVKSSAIRLSQQQAAANLLIRAYEEVTIYGYRYDAPIYAPGKKTVFASMDRMHKKLSKTK